MQNNSLRVIVFFCSAVYREWYLGYVCSGSQRLYIK
jgi:hypothetical protein